MAWLTETFGVAKPVVGMIHLPPLPGTARMMMCAALPGSSKARSGTPRRYRRAGLTP